MEDDDSKESKGTPRPTQISQVKSSHDWDPDALYGHYMCKKNTKDIMYLISFKNRADAVDII